MFGSRIERDPEITRLRNAVNQKLWEIVQEQFPVEEQQPVEEIKFVSFEDALKELVALKNS
jgi:hypothetical protein